MSNNKFEKRNRDKLTPERPNTEEYVVKKPKHNMETKVMPGQGWDLDAPVNNVPLRELLGAFQGIIENSLDKFKNVIREEFKEDIAVVKSQNQELKELVAELKNDLEHEKKKIEFLDVKSRRNNLIFRNLPINPDIHMEVGKVIHEKLKIAEKIPTMHVAKVGGKGNTMDLKVEFCNQQDIIKIFKKIKELKGTNIAVDRDLTKNAQEKKSAMLILRRQLRDVLGNLENVVVRGDKLKVNQTIFYWKDDQLMTGNKSGEVEIKKILKNDLRNIVFSLSSLLEKSKVKDIGKHK